ncbi:hypothetical protein [Alteromonas oceanisediminis]|uniref:hypothetical protein n=1 Tax=Alteromonas oceanisediminis TaxID=2836180 RepID=UPI001BD9E38D|nr:hypothetical protein [Alteromonas oceanisediminis]MBT0587536.1 hypothetical protein [Alteromonas oceanisediminis]
MSFLRLVLLSLAGVFSTPSLASLILVEQPSDYKKLFFSEVKVDENLSSGATAGKDVFLTHGEQWGNNTTRDLAWKSLSNSALFSHQFTWSLSRSGTTTTFKLDDFILTHTSAAGVWNTLGIWMNVSGFDGLFSSSSLTFSVDGNDFGVTRDTPSTFYLQHQNGQALTDVSGTATFSWALDPNYAGTRFNPNGRAMFSIKALEAQSVPEPEALALALVGGLMLMCMRRRQYAH